MAFLNSPRIITDSLVFCYDAANTRSYPGTGTTWSDLSRTGIDSTLFSGVSFSSIYAGALTFTSSSKQFIKSTNAGLSGNQTLSVWASATGTNINSPAGILTNYNNSTTSNFGINHINGNKLAASIGYTDGSNEFQTSTTTFTITNNVVFNAVLTYNSSENKIYWYVNGQLDSSYPLTKTPRSTNFPITLGRWEANFDNYYFDGNIYYASVYSKVLSATEILQNYNTLKTRFGLT